MTTPIPARTAHPRQPLDALAGALLQHRTPGMYRAALGRPNAKLLASLYVHLPEDSPAWTREQARALAAVYAHHPRHVDKGPTLARALGRLGDPGIERRFRALLDADTDTRYERLVTVVRLAAKRNLPPINLFQLARDLPTLGLQGTTDRWAGDYYTRPAEAPADA